MKRNFITQLVRWQESQRRKPLLIRGMRQVGKTYTITEFGAKYFPKIHYVNFEDSRKVATIFEEDLQPKRIIAELGFLLDATIDPDHDLLFFDEIQACPRALTSLKYFCEGMPQLAVCAAGSLLGVYLAPVSFPVGKVDILDVFPMSFEEFLFAIDDIRSVDYLREVTTKTVISEVVHSHIWQQMKNYFIVGGLPEVVQIYRDNRDHVPAVFDLVRQQQQTLITTYNADIAKHSGKVNAMHINRVWQAVPTQLAREQNDSINRFKFKGIIPGESRYRQLIDAIDWLEAAGLIIKVKIANAAELPLAAYTKENIFKLLMADIGLLGAMSDLAPVAIHNYDYGTYKGYFAENFVAQEFICAGIKQLYSWQDQRSEIEFLRSVDDKVIPVEVKAGKITKAKSMRKFINKYRPLYGIILSGNKLHIDKNNKIHRYPLYLASKFPLLAA